MPASIAINVDSRLLTPHCFSSDGFRYPEQFKILFRPTRLRTKTQTCTLVAMVGDLRREAAMNVKRLMDLGCYKGLRHRKGLPVYAHRTQPPFVRIDLRDPSARQFSAIHSPDRVARNRRRWGSLQ